jgi:ABC-2 type transport system permease protein
MTVNYSILEIPFRGHALDITFMFLLFFLALIPLGVWLGTIIPNQLMAAQIMVFSTYPVFLIAGYAWPFEALPVYMQWLSSLIPTTPFLKVYISISQMGGTLADNTEAIVHLILLCILYVLLAIWGIRRLNKRQQSLSL